MIKIGYVAPKKSGKTQFLIRMIKDELSQGHKCYYLGGQKHYEEVCEKLKKENNTAKLEFITKDLMPTEDDCAVFTDNLTWEMTSIFPYALRAMIKLHCNWYYTIPKEETIIYGEELDVKELEDLD